MPEEQLGSQGTEVANDCEAVWVLGIEPGSSAKAAIALSH